MFITCISFALLLYIASGIPFTKSTGIYFYYVNKFAGYLLIPYFIWVGFASFLNYTLWKLNK
ncbi:MAG: tryptophan-rich sensory protein [archaeon]